MCISLGWNSRAVPFWPQSILAASLPLPWPALHILGCSVSSSTPRRFHLCNALLLFHRIHFQSPISHAKCHPLSVSWFGDDFSVTSSKNPVPWGYTFSAPLNFDICLYSRP